MYVTLAIDLIQIKLNLPVVRKKSIYLGIQIQFFRFVKFGLTLSIIILLRIDTIKNDDINPVWCFLENVRDPSDSKSGCYSDTRWSSRDGRFWSSEACKGLPPLSFEGIDELQVSQ